jgi:Putative zinc-finger
MSKSNNLKNCENFEINAYIDGDLSLAEEFEIENHFSVCTDCSRILRDQKSLLCAMNYAFKSPTSSFELPKNFASTIVTKAESNVNGLRCPLERKRALGFCIILLAIVAAGIGESRFQILDFGLNLFDNFVAISSFTVHFVYDAVAGLTSVLGGISDQIFFFSDISTFVLMALFFFILIGFSHLLIRYHRA